MKKMIIKDENEVDIELLSEKVGNTEIITKEGSENKVVIFLSDYKKIQEFKETVITEEEEEEILGPVLFNVLKKIRK